MAISSFSNYMIFFIVMIFLFYALFFSFPLTSETDTSGN